MQAVLFDMDGLMFNSEDIYYASSEEIARRRGKIYTPEIDKMINAHIALLKELAKEAHSENTIKTIYSTEYVVNYSGSGSNNGADGSGVWPGGVSP